MEGILLYPSALGKVLKLLYFSDNSRLFLQDSVGMTRGEELTKGVTIYTKPGCPFCMAAKADLKLKGVEYIEYNVKADPKKLKEMLQLNGGQRKVPTVVDEERVTVGFAGY